MKKAQNQKMTELTDLNHDNFNSSIRKAWTNQHSWKTGNRNELAMVTPNFMFPIFMFHEIEETSPARIRRATLANIESARVSINNHTQIHGMPSLGPAALQYAATIAARSPTDTPISIPNDATFRQLTSIDNQQQLLDQEHQNRLGNHKRQLDIFIGGVLIPITLDVATVTVFIRITSTRSDV